MIFWICLAALIGSVVWGIIDGWWETVPILLTVTFGIIVLIMGAVICFSNCDPDAQLEAELAKRDVLVYQLNNKMYDNDNDLGKKELMNEIREWNSDIAYCKSAQDNFWEGIFIPNIYDQIDLIELVN